MNLQRNYTFFHIILNFFFIGNALNGNHKFYLLLILLCNIIYLGLMIYFYIRKWIFQKKLNNIIYDDTTLLYSELSLPEAFDSDTKLIHDITEHANRNYRKIIKNFEMNDLEYKEFIELWIHEIKTPLSAIYLLNKNEKIEDELNRIDNNLNFALYYAKSNAINKDYFIQSLSLKLLLSNTIKKHKNIFLSKKISPILFEEDVFINSDQKWLEFVLFQIIDNALKYSHPNSKIDFTIQTFNHRIRLNIIDYGLGIPKHDLPRVFEKGFSGSNREIEKSTGLGLYLVKKICDQLNHHIEIQSHDSKTIVSIDFPLEEQFI